MIDIKKRWTITDVGNLPAGEHWVILTNRTEAIPGDERSRTNPGHGYPASTLRYIEYEVFLIEADFRKTLAERLANDVKYPDPNRPWVTGIHVQGTYTSSVMIELQERK
jgi:hypothetical protein